MRAEFCGRAALPGAWLRVSEISGLLMAHWEYSRTGRRVCVLTVNDARVVVHAMRGLAQLLGEGEDYRRAAIVRAKLKCENGRSRRAKLKRKK